MLVVGAGAGLGLGLGLGLGSMTAGARLVARNVTRGTILAADVESADSLFAKFMGLMGRPGIADGAGLWLPDSNGIHMMFMRFPIDAVFLGKPGSSAGGPGARGPVDAGRKVVAVRRALPAWRGLVPFIRGAHGVLELPVGAIDASGTVVGDSVLIGPGE